MSNKVHPIKPGDLGAEKQKLFPDAVLESFNELITQKWSGGSANIRQDDVIVLMVKKGLQQKEIYANGWLDVEDIYRAAGWSVIYDKPAYNESYSATFTFAKK